jgi:hypothetical protein
MPVARLLRILMALAALLTPQPAPAPGSGSSSDNPLAVSLKVLDENVAPGAVGQMKVFVTEPMPISTGRGGVRFAAFSSVDGVALTGTDNATWATALVNGPQIDLSIVSPKSTFGLDSSYPIFTIAGRVSNDTPVGASFPFILDPAAITLRDPSGALYPVDGDQAVLRVAAGAMTIDDVQPGSADLPAGAVVRVLGTNLTRKTEIRFSDTKIAYTKFVSSSEIDVVLGSCARMHGRRIRAKNPDGTEATYYSYQRTRPAGASTDPAFAGIVPVFPKRTSKFAIVDLSGDFAGIALQNIESSDAFVKAELLRDDGVVLGSKTLWLASYKYLVRSIPELFGISYAPGLHVRIRASGPVETMGVSAAGDGSVSPIPPR